MSTRSQTRSGSRRASATAGAHKPKQQFHWRSLLSSGSKVKRQDLISFSRELATLLDAGVGISASLELLASQRKNTPFEKVLNSLRADLASGATISEAMAKHPDVFSKLFVRTMSTADRGAPLADTLKRAAGFLDSAQSAIAQAKRAMIYPAMVMIVGIGMVTMLLLVSLPQMINLFSNLNAELPLPTKILVGFSDFLKAKGMYVLPALVVLGFLGLRGLKTPKGRLWFHKVLLKAPVISKVIMASDLSRSSTALAALSEAGLPLPEALDVARDTVSNEVIRNALTDAQKGLMSGEGLSRPLARAGIFPPMFVQTLRVAEDTGTLDANLRRMGDMYGKDASEKVKALASLVEPLATVSVALAVGFIALAVILPMYTVLGAIDKGP